MLNKIWYSCFFFSSARSRYPPGRIWNYQPDWLRGPWKIQWVFGLAVALTRGTEFSVQKNLLITSQEWEPMKIVMESLSRCVSNGFMKLLHGLRYSLIQYFWSSRMGLMSWHFLTEFCFIRKQHTLLIPLCKWWLNDNFPRSKRFTSSTVNVVGT